MHVGSADRATECPPDSAEYLSTLELSKILRAEHLHPLWVRWRSVRERPRSVHQAIKLISREPESSQFLAEGPLGWRSVRESTQHPKCLSPNSPECPTGRSVNPWSVRYLWWRVRQPIQSQNRTCKPRESTPQRVHRPRWSIRGICRNVVMFKT